MDLSSGVGKKKAGSGGAVSTKRAPKKSAKRPSRKDASKKSKSKRKAELPKTVRALSRKSKSFSRTRASRANSAMSITDLQFLAKSRGVPFGGLTKTKLIRKINNYY